MEKNLALNEVNGESPSPKVKRKPRKSEKENESSTHVIDSYKNMKKSIKQKSENRPKPRNDFTVDIFTSKTTEEKEIENINHANDDKTLALQVHKINLMRTEIFKYLKLLSKQIWFCFRIVMILML